MEKSLQPEKKAEEIKNRTVTNEIVSDRESSIESFHTNKSEPSNTTETELIDLDDVELSDEESWLYKSPKKVTSDEKSANTQKWLQKNIDDMDDVELKATRTALLTKLNQLKLLNCSVEEKEASKYGNRSNATILDSKAEAKKTPKFAPVTDRVSKLLSDMSMDDAPPPERNSSKTDKNCSGVNQGRKCSIPDERSRNENEVFDLVDVQKIARLQEESLKQSTSKFLNQSGKRTMSSKDLVPTSPVQIASLNKPASVEGLNTCADKLNQSTVYSSLVPLHNMKKQSMFNSSSALNCSPEFHRGSLPNINKGYNSLKSRKPKRPSDPKVSCPLPIYPAHSKVSQNGMMPQDTNDTFVKSRTPSVDHRDSRTLPSSYRINSRRNSSSRRESSALSPSPRRESTPLWGSNSSLEASPRENYRKFSSPSNNGYSRYCSSPQVSPTKTFNSLPKNLRSPSLESQRRPSHSPSRRLPLSPVQHQSPKRGGNGGLASPRNNGEIRSLKAPSKIPSPASRSGIPVPSTTTHISKANEEDTWSQDCF